MRKSADISVSTLPLSDYQNIVEYAKQMQGVAEFLHCDVTNANFVSKSNYDYNLVGTINRNSIIMLDVHLMVNEPTADIQKYIEAGANIITVHYEAFENKQDLVNVIKYIQQNGVLAGIALKTSTPFKEIKSFVFNCDVILIMGVDLGETGQSAQEEMFERVKEVDDFRTQNNLKFKIEFDGGVNAQNAKRLTELGVDILVSGNFVYNSKNRKDAVKKLKCVD